MVVRFEKIIARLESEPSTDTVKWAENSIYAMADCLVAKKDSSRLCTWPIGSHELIAIDVQLVCRRSCALC